MAEKRFVFDAKSIEKTIEDINDGLKLNTNANPWYQNEVGLRKPGVVYRMSKEEQMEYIKCATDVHYFVEKYCKVKSEDGSVKAITLRDYQKEILDNFVNNRFNILMASRQVGKCVGFNTEVEIVHNDTTYTCRMGRLYYFMVSRQRKLLLTERIKILLYDILYVIEKK